MLLPDLNGVFDIYHHGENETAADNNNNTENNISIVTAFFSFGRDEWGQTRHINKIYERSIHFYLDSFKRLSKIKNQLIVFVDSEFAEYVLNARKEYGLENRTVILTSKSVFSHPKVKSILDVINAKIHQDFRLYVWQPDVPEYNSAHYVLVNALKSYLVMDSINKGLVDSDQIAWIDFGYCRRDDILHDDSFWRFDCNGKMNLFHIFPIDNMPIFQVVKTGFVYFQGCHIVGPKREWAMFNQSLDQSLQSLLNCDLVDDDQTLLLMAYRQNPEKYRIHAVDRRDWFIVFKLFNENVSLKHIEIENRRVKKTPVWLKEFKLALKRSNPIPSMNKIKSMFSRFNLST